MRPAAVVAACFALALIGATTAGASDPWAKLRRPLHIPRIPAGAKCPVTPLASANGSKAQGTGPVYPVGAYRALWFIYPPTPEQVWYGSEWSGQKILWIARPSYRGPVLIRGRQLDGPHELRFERGQNPAREFRLTSVGGSMGSSGWQDRPSYTRVRAPGCYAWQVDGTSFSNVIVFRAIVTSPK